MNKLELKVKDYIENCLEMVRIDIKMYKKFKGWYDNKFWLEDAEKYINFADLALEHNMLPSELKTKDCKSDISYCRKGRLKSERKKLIKVEVIE